jgi:DNA-directed RNA polymerase specialized sigma24 family protein
MPCLHAANRLFLAKDKYKPNVDSVFKHDVDIDDIQESYTDEAHKQDRSQLDIELRLFIKEKLKDQPEKIQEILILNVSYGISIADLAKIYNMDYAALRKRIYRIKKQLSISVKVDEVIWAFIFLANVPFLLQLDVF